MFFLKAGHFSISKNLVGYVDDHRYYIKHAKQLLSTVRTYSCVDHGNSKAHLLFLDASGSRAKFLKNTRVNVQSRGRFLKSAIDGCKFCTSTLPKDANKFGDVAGQTYESVPMDEAEEKEEKFAESVTVPKRHRFLEDDYVSLIRFHLKRKDLGMALSVFDMIRGNGDKPNLFMYRLLISAYAIQGDVKQCFKLFKGMRDRGLPPHPGIINSLINACSETDDSKTAIERLSYLREFCHEKQIPLNQTHYATFVKAYGRHNQPLLAFELADLARDNRIDSTDIVSALFHTVITDKINGLKYALILWHKMKITRIKRNLYHYNLLLRAIRDTKFGDLKIDSDLIPGARDTRIVIAATGRPDLLDSPPVITDSVVSMVKHPSAHVIPDRNEAERSVAVQSKPPSSMSLNSILKENRLLLFGGIEKLFERMKEDDVIPNRKTVTLILELLPFTLDAEKYLLRYIEKNHISVDITFYNVLIKRRSLRGKYESAKDVMNEIQKAHLVPNNFTFSALAIGCKHYADGMELLQQMDTIGYTPNVVVLQTLLVNACTARHFKYVLNLMQYMLDNRMNPTEPIMEGLERFDELVLQISQSEGRYSYKEVNMVRKFYNNFKIRYENWKEKIEKNMQIKSDPDKHKILEELSLQAEEVSKTRRRRRAMLKKYLQYFIPWLKLAALNPRLALAFKRAKQTLSNV